MNRGLGGWLRVTTIAVVGIGALTSTPLATSAEPRAAPSKATPLTRATVDQPRPFGYVVGDLVTQRVSLRTSDSDFQPELPEAQRLNIWFERRTPRIELGPDGYRWLVVDYQIINAPQVLIRVTLPQWALQSERGNAKLTIPAWTISIAPLTPRSAFAAQGFGELRPDRAAPVVTTSSSQRQALIWSIGFLVVVLLWLVWQKWRNWREAMNQPFARALSEIDHRGEASPQSWQALHRAFDRTAGRVMQIETLPALFQRAPHLQPLRTEIENFFVQSSARFFGAGVTHESLSVRVLCGKLLRLEKRNAR
ncbi:MAG TPA: hypothetical protein VGN07_13595 [Steroidobacteraceae bacterium]|jgi:mxaA protein